MDDFLRHCIVEKNLSQKTLKAYGTDLGQFRKFLEEQTAVTIIEEVSKIELRSYFETLTPRKPRTIKRKAATLKAFFNFMEADEQVAHNPMRQVKLKLKEAKQLPKVMQAGEIKKILQSAYNNRRQDYTHYKSMSTLRDILVIELLFSTGARVSELVGLKTTDINLQNGEIILNGKGRKQRIIQVCNDELLQLLRQYRKTCGVGIAAADGYLLVNRFNKPLSDQSVRAIIRRLTLQSSVNKHVTPHMFRHSFATLLLDNDVDIKYIQSMLGHSSITTTQIYTHVSKQKQKQLLRTRHPRRNMTFSYVAE